MLKCNICGGELRYSNEKYTCVNCGTDFALNQVYENIEVCICNIENEDSGARTVASHISAEIYTLLESNRIKTYYSRVAAADLFGEELERANISAISGAKVILLVGTKATEFQTLLDKYGQFSEKKVVVPVFKDIDAKTLPKNISVVQGVDYAKIGASSDLVKGVLKVLGRGDEYDYAAISGKSRIAKRAWFLVGVSILILVIAIVIAIIVLGPKDKSHNENTEQETAEVTETTLSVEDRYLAAKALADAEQYADAIVAFGEIADYKDSQKQINLLYQKYAGYYTDTNTNIDLHMKIANTNIASIELTYYTQDNYVCKINVIIPLTDIAGSFEFDDSENNAGNISFLFTNDAVQVQIKTEDKAGELFFPDSESVFPLSEKTDVPIRTVTIEQLISLVKTKTLISDLNRRGIEAISQGNDGDPGKLNIYEIANTDIVLYASWDTQPHIYAISVPTSFLEGTAYSEIRDATKKEGVYFLPGGIYYDSSRIDIFTDVSCSDGEDIDYYYKNKWRGLEWYVFGYGKLKNQILSQNSYEYLYIRDEIYEDESVVIYKVIATKEEQIGTLSEDELYYGIKKNDYTIMDERSLAANYLAKGINIFLPNVVAYAICDINVDGLDDYIAKTGRDEAGSSFDFYIQKNGEYEYVGTVSASSSGLYSDGVNIIVHGGKMGYEHAYKITYTDNTFASTELFSRETIDGEYTQWPIEIPIYHY